MPDPLPAAIFLPDEDGDRWLEPCMAYVGRHPDLSPVAVVRGDWDQVQAMVDDGTAAVVVSALREHPPADRVPRIVFVEEEGPAPTGAQRRPRLIPRDGEG